MLRYRAAGATKFRRPAMRPYQPAQSRDSTKWCRPNAASLAWPSFEQLRAVRCNLVSGTQACQNLDIAIEGLPDRYVSLFWFVRVFDEHRRRISFTNDRRSRNDKRLMRTHVDVNHAEHLRLQA